MGEENIPAIKIRTSGSYVINENSFECVSPESAYWIGMLITDGNIFDTRINLSVSEKDFQHLVKFRNFLLSNNKIEFKKAVTNKTINSRNHFRFQVRCKKIVADLSKFGVVPAKSRNAKINILEYNKDFWRGVMDGDGCINIHPTRYKRDHERISLVGSKELLTQFSNFVRYHHPKCKATVHSIKNKKLYCVQIQGTVAVKLLRLLYQNSTIFLDRKYEKAMTLLKEHYSQP